MDSRLFEAARTGNVDELLSLLQANPLILQASAMEGGTTPLHVAAMAGHLDFTKQVLNLMPSYSTEVNPDGLTALHMVSAMGEVEVLKELLRVGGEGLSLLKGRERRIALHYAAMKGRLEVMKELLAVCPRSVEEVTVWGETAVYLAVKNNQFEAFVELVEWLRKSGRQSIVNWKNRQGNTVLHLAVDMKQLEVVEFLLTGNSLIEVNALNSSGLTALDLLSIFSSEAGDREIGDILIQAGALTAQSIVPHSGGENDDDDSTNYASPQERTPPKWCRRILNFIRHNHGWLDYFKYKKDRDSSDFVRSALLLVAALIVTATYSAVLQPPGGLWQDDWPPIGSNVTSIGKPHKAGQSVLGTVNPISYALFLCFNSLGFFASIQMIAYLTTGFPLRMELRIALSALIATYDTAMGSLTPNTFFNFFFVGLSIVMPIVMSLLSVWMRK